MYKNKRLDSRDSSNNVLINNINTNSNTVLDDVDLSDNGSVPRRSKLNNPYVISTLVLLNIIWGYNIYKRVNKMLSNNYSNVIYQIRKPNSISNRFWAFKYFILGGSVVPITFLSFVYYTNFRNNKLNTRMNSNNVFDLNLGDNIGRYVNEASKCSTNTPDAHSKNYNSRLLIDDINSVLSKYSNNASVRLENLSENVKRFVPKDNFRNMGVDLKKDINKLKGLFSNIF
ncbi:conserved hypothetical protein [Theileria orientalis strain Shintoku]|uniref:Uncharacterized protein n=1 Tax=Theileria orientalis strain Shintoku TaxID=869250 RepID=J4D7A6_THEOR|nr:conserved hypothetical protein [Theileria orientalis strain Shintoku]BAM40065.1 conserved hypothetical protein [Theileria orientalis strain Shintoku]|eukprot:XP_009690366.1 conserved hypothetical protein [Theileria orientalis strain Shintoku]